MSSEDDVEWRRVPATSNCESAPLEPALHSTHSLHGTAMPAVMWKRTAKTGRPDDDDRRRIKAWCERASTVSPRGGITSGIPSIARRRRVIAARLHRWGFNDLILHRRVLNGRRRLNDWVRGDRVWRERRRLALGDLDLLLELPHPLGEKLNVRGGRIARSVGSLRLPRRAVAHHIGHARTLGRGQ